MSRAWCFTVNNPEEEIKFKKQMNYLLYTEQKAPTTGTIHYQGYVQFFKSKALTGAKNMIPGAHLSIARGTLAQNKAYIVDDEKKTNTGLLMEHGVAEDIAPEKNKQGKRTDIKKMLRMVEEKKSYFEIVEEHPEAFGMYEKMIERHRMECEEKDNKEIEFPVTLPWCTIDKPDPANKQRHYWVWGPSDVGKTRAMQEALKGTKTFLASNNNYVFESYRDEELLVFDDCMPSLEEILDCSNTWELRKERAGGSRYIKRYWKKGQTRTILVLANHPPPFRKQEFWTRFNVVEIKAAGGVGTTNKPPAALPGGERLIGSNVYKRKEGIRGADLFQLDVAGVDLNEEKKD